MILANDARARSATGDCSYTPGMKTAVSVPNDVFERADRLARSTGRSRSEVYSEALTEYLSRHAPDEVTETLDRVVAALGKDAAPNGFARQAAKRRLASNDW